LQTDGDTKRLKVYPETAKARDSPNGHLWFTRGLAVCNGLLSFSFSVLAKRSLLLNRRGSAIALVVTGPLPKK